ncbi:hypothetical protein COW36_17865 [bacterium (Candidatus Blackallbacteria) CG17_big_fil_post_rev_8_21_14_2_50_48_46]|uniref:Glycine zipper domain-containing protein n=1 Tax=bacterium (Candidatus Blackallbacteria) CG17_big_fil_post_rev_8_21_14_2_50_48_46 TaxID=2014261 RepID=A0A2M7G0Z3_9BACT|nr:MAG: hypothetical protein COW64_00860 [bacterium (Candidatus Blackallbacteria) CG18_big_fil_WC_8_21_14_2_50_49_26]PIW15283.1 MAG: hypothetical protein COW36_17865 [bacterium (Candidatus Blackallbacteria) CG17_big_fil_post_rev_8_21_14_2_50_48_46]PIW45208.1 MAG: hypothetical protein COW20_21150 [bacterium (Candidatus Blackallbacteria) CG13_big_fil_rev_8_21_14_2_50_49_14]
MSTITAVSNTPLLNTPVQAPKAAPQQTAPVTENKALLKDSNDITELKRGMVPTLKGAGAGALGGAMAAGVPLALMALGSHGEGKGWAQLFALAGAMGGAVTGGLAGGVAANTTESKLKGAAVGAGVGALVGGLALAGKNLSSGNIKDAVAVGVLGAVVGGVTGAAGGLAGAMTASRK